MGSEQKKKEHERWRSSASAAAVELRLLAGEVRENAKESRRLMLACIEVLLAGEDLISADTVAVLLDQKNVDTFRNEIPGPPGEEIVSDEIGGDDEPQSPEHAVELEDTHRDAVVEEIAKALDMYTPPFQREVLDELLRKLPGKEAEYELEVARDSARDEFINYMLQNTSCEEEAAMYSRLLKVVQSDAALEAFKKIA